MTTTETTPAAEPAILPALPELLALAAAVRGQDWADRLAPAMVGARDAGWDWERAGRFASDLIFSRDGDPKDLTDAAKPANRRETGTPPPADYRAARQALNGASE